MTQPLALLLYEKPSPGSRLSGAFESLNYRTLPLSDPAELATTAQRELPMILVVELHNRRAEVLAAVTALHADPATAHLPVIAFTSREDDTLRTQAHEAGIKVLTTDSAILMHLAEFVEHALQLD